MHVCAALGEMMYGTIYSGGSGTYSHTMLKGLANYMNFSNARYQQQFLQGYEEWVQMLYNELKVAKAVYFDGSSSEGGHAFVIDGYYKEDLFHVNWVWSGLANDAQDDGGYYRINSLLPINQGTGGAVVNDGYRFDQTFFTGIYPNAPASTEDLSITASVLNTNQTHAYVKQGKLRLHLFSNGTNQTAPVITAQVALCLENESGYKSLMPLNDGLSTLYLTEALNADTVLTWTGVTDGDYKVHMYYRTTLGDTAWAPCRNYDKSYVSVQVSNGKAVIKNIGLIEAELLSCNLKEQYAKGEDITVTLKYKMTNGELRGMLLALIALPVKENEEGDFEADKSRAECVGMPPATINAKEGEEVTIESTFQATNMDVGKYELICACLGGFLPTDMTFDVVAATGTPAIIVDKSAVQDNAEWYDMQGRKFTT